MCIPNITSIVLDMGKLQGIETMGGFVLRNNIYLGMCVNWPKSLTYLFRPFVAKLANRIASWR